MVNYMGRNMQFNSFDIEVYQNYWEVRSTNWELRSDDSFPQTRKNLTRSEVLQATRSEILVGYNIKHYDMIILHEILFGNPDPSNIFELSSKIINYNKGILDISYWNKFYFLDLFDFAKSANNDMRIGLKMLASNLDLPIEETQIDFENHKIDDDNFELHSKYLDSDVYVTEQLMKHFSKLIDIKLSLAELFKIDKMKSLKSTFAKISTLILHNNRKYQIDLDDVYYEIPDRLKKLIYANVPKDVINYFTKTPIEEIKTYKTRAFGNDIVLGTGGIHSTCSDNVIYRDGEGYTLSHDDMESYYPNLILEYGFDSRGLDINKYKSLIDERIKIKKEIGYDQSNKQLQSVYDSYKVLINAVYGLTGDKFSPIYDPKQALNISITGQLVMFAIANTMFKQGIMIIQTNTDGIVCYYPDELKEIHNMLVENITETVGINFESDKIDTFVQFNVNNYIEVEGEKITTKGKIVKNWQNNDITTKNYPIVQKAIVDYFVKKIDLEKTIYGATNMSWFANTTSAGRTYNQVYYGTIDRVVTNLQKINRILCVNDTNNILYKKKETGNPQKIADQGEGVFVCNGDIPKKVNIDYDFYLNRAIKIINEVKHGKYFIKNI